MYVAAVGLPSCQPEPSATMHPEALVVSPKCVTYGLEGCNYACESGDADACLAASTAYRDDRVKASRLQHRACTLGSAQGCSDFADNIELQDEQKARQYRAQACEGGYEPACEASRPPALMDTAVYTPGPPEQSLALTEAAREGWDVQTVIGFCVDATGGTVEVEVNESSGDPDVDDLYLEAVRRWQFEPIDEPGTQRRRCATKVFRLRFDHAIGP